MSKDLINSATLPSADEMKAIGVIIVSPKIRVNREGSSLFTDADYATHVAKDLAKYGLHNRIIGYTSSFQTGEINGPWGSKKSIPSESDRRATVAFTTTTNVNDQELMEGLYHLAKRQYTFGTIEMGLFDKSIIPQLSGTDAIFKDVSEVVICILDGKKSQSDRILKPNAPHIKKVLESHI